MVVTNQQIITKDKRGQTIPAYLFYKRYEICARSASYLLITILILHNQSLAMKYFILSIALFTLACNNEPEEKQAPETVAPAPAPSPEEPQSTPLPNSTTCFTGNSGRDTITLSVINRDNQVSGTLDYDFFEKDKNHGSLSGHMHGDTLIADYIFTSEGMQSIRQVAFLKKGGTLTEGYGPQEKRDGKMVFSNPAKLNFGQGFALQQVDCE